MLSFKEYQYLYHKALNIIMSSHHNQKDRAGALYIEHLLRVSLNCTTQEAKIAALLHDVIEDSNITEEDLRREGFPEDIVLAVSRLTHTDDVPYEGYIKNDVTRDKIAREVKLEDLKDNMNIMRLKKSLKKIYIDFKNILMPGDF